MNNNNAPWKILELLKATEKLFREKSIISARLNAELLLANSLNIERINLYTDFEKPLNENELNIFREKVKHRLNFEPLQYILGEAHFYGKKFKVNSSVLIPRPETELLVDKTIEFINKKQLTEPKILEIGTGSGCIAISIAADINCMIDATDIDEHAIKTAKENSEKYKLKGTINLIIKNFLEDDVDLGKYNIVISNPPYIPKKEFNSLAEEIKNFEPEYALTDNNDGLEFYRKIFTLYNSAYRKPAVFLEIGDGKKDIVEKLIIENSINNYTFHKDLLRIYRILEF